MGLDGRVAIISGAGRGIGRGAAIALAQAGADIAINYLDDQSEAEEVAGQVEKAGRKALLLQGDVSDHARVEEMVAQTRKDLGRLDVAVPNAVFSKREAFCEADLGLFHRTFEVSMFGAYYLTRAAATAMIEQGEGGCIVVISSPHAYIPIPKSTAYNMCKAALDQMIATAATELTDYRIRVNGIYPGWIDTPGERKFFTEEQIRESGAKLPWGRLGRPDEIGRGVAFLADPDSDYITGTMLRIDGGISLPWWAKKGSAAPE